MNPHVLVQPFCTENELLNSSIWWEILQKFFSSSWPQRFVQLFVDWEVKTLKEQSLSLAERKNFMFLLKN